MSNKPPIEEYKMGTAEAREFVRDAKKSMALAVANMDQDQAETYRRSMTNRAIMEGYQMIEELSEIAKDKAQSGGVRVSAISILLDRAMGKPLQEIKIEDESRTKHLTTSQLIAFAETLGIPGFGSAQAGGRGPIIEAETGAIPALSKAD